MIFVKEEYFFQNSYWHKVTYDTSRGQIPKLIENIGTELPEDVNPNQIVKTLTWKEQLKS